MNGAQHLQRKNRCRSAPKALIFPFVTKDGSLNSIGTVTDATFNTSFQYGDMITGSYPMSSSITREYFSEGHGATATTGSHILALKNTLKLLYRFKQSL